MTRPSQHAANIAWLAALLLASSCSANGEHDTGVRTPSSRADAGAADASSGANSPGHRPDAGVPGNPIFHFDAGRRPGFSDDAAATVCSAEAHEAQKLQLDMLVVPSRRTPRRRASAWD
jgi:hypothetical protein